ncbi:MAG: sigma-70 family RNA polymerase sigma factor [Victivallales bacterium]|nr:sigma-70 family RNA polymerase sigma factor [Victivallales bacterium]
MSNAGDSDDRRLVERFKAGDEEAFDALVDRHSARAYQIAYGVLGNREDAEEVAQDAFIRMHRALPAFRGESEFTTWMYRIVTNLARNKYRWNKARKTALHDSIDAPVEAGDGDARAIELPDTGNTPEEEAVYAELDQALQSELGKLPEAQRQVLVMRNVQDMSYEDIAAALKCKIGTVKSRLARAREELCRRLGL